MNIRLSLIFLLLFTVGNVIHAQDKAFVRVEGQCLIKPDGTNLLMQGTNLGNWLNPEGYMLRLGAKADSYLRMDQAFREMVGEVATDKFWRDFQKNYITEEDIQYIRSTGMNTVRLPFNHRLITDTPFMGYASKEHGYQVLDEVIGWCKKAGLYVVLDMHTAPGGQTGMNIDDSYGYPWLLTEEENKAEYCRLWKEVAKRYANEPTIVAYDLLNEPIASEFFPQDTAMFKRELEMLFKRVIAEIRKVDSNHIVMVSGAYWGQDYSLFHDWNYDDNLMFTCHRYHSEPTKQGYHDFFEWREKFNRPFYMGEAGHEPDEWIERFCKMLNEENMGWTLWPYKKIETKNSQNSPLSIVAPEDWNLVSNFISADRSTYQLIRENRPDQQKARAALDAFIEAMKFKNCTINKGYIRAMGFNPDNKVTVANAKSWTLTNDVISVSFDDKTAQFCVTDLRNGKQWTQQGSSMNLKVQSVKQKNGCMNIMFSTPYRFKVDVTLTDNAGVHFEVSAQAKQQFSELMFPMPFTSGSSDDYLLMTDGEGILLPVTDRDYPLSDGMTFFSGGGVCMPWMGVVDKDLNAGHMVILETPYDARISVERQQNGLLAFAPIWYPTMQQWGYSRKMTYHFFDQGGYVAQAKRYRDYVWNTRPMATLREKAKTMPSIDRMLGAPHIYVWDDGRQLDVAREIKQAGIDKALFLWDGNHYEYPEPGYDNELRAMGYATGGYTLFTDLHKKDTAMYEFDYQGPRRFTNSVYPGLYNKLAARKADGSIYSNQFGTYACPSVMEPEMVKRLDREFKEYPHDCVFFDVYQANGLYECYNKSHQVSRTQYAEAIIHNLKTATERYNIYAGGEWGADYAAPYSIFAHGMMTIQWPWWKSGEIDEPGSIYNYGTWRNNPHPDIQVGTALAAPSYMKYSANETIRIPLYELVYHDAVVSSWRWEDANHKNPEIWWKKDLFNVLYGSAPLWSIDKERWKAYRKSLADSYKRICPTINAVAYDEMVSHQFLTTDHKVQRTDFSSGHSVIVNFSDTDFEYEGKTIKSRSFEMLEP